jgi:hypothetical protein
MIRLSQRFIRLCYERCFLKDKTIPLHRSIMTILNLSLQFSTLFSNFIRDQERQRRKQRQQLVDADADHLTRSGRRTSFNIMKLQRPGYEREELSSSDSDEYSDREEEEDEDLAELEEDEDEGMEVDENEIELNRIKKQKMGLDPSTANTQGSHISTASASAAAATTTRGASTSSGAALLSGQRHGTAAAARKRSHGGLATRISSSSSTASPGHSYREQLEAIEQEFDRCRAFLAKSLKVVVNANAARGYVSSDKTSSFADNSQGSGAWGSAEGGSNYLDGLILALST